MYEGYADTNEDLISHRDNASYVKEIVLSSRKHRFRSRRNRNSPLPSSSSPSPSPAGTRAYRVKPRTNMKRHKSFNGGEKPNISRFKSTSLKSFTGTTIPTSPVQIVKSVSRGSASSGLGSESALSPNFFRRKPNYPLSPESLPTSLGNLSRRNTYNSLVVPEESPTEIKRRCTYSGASKQEQIDDYMNKPITKPRSIYDPGRVQVFVRVRPPNDTEDISKYPLAVSVTDEERTQLKLFDGKNDRCYQFDGILNDDATNKEVYTTVGEPLVYSALSGFNGILMCYGQTGTGKTYTLMSNDGMLVRIVYQCFNVINKDKRHKYTVTCSYLQIYQEKIFDLLNETRTIELSLREHPKTGVYIENLTEYVVHSPKEVLDLLKVGKRRLVFAETKMNRASSRSHAICQFKILKERIGNDSGNKEETPPLYIRTPELEDEDSFLDESNNESYQLMMDEDDDEDEDILCHVPDLEDGVTSVRGKLYICDLAGSERIKKTRAAGERLHEAQHINSSLLELGNVIQALAEGKRSHVPFRNSTLTRLLQEGLSGNCKTRLVVCVAPTIRDVHETKCSLNFGSRAIKIQVMAHVNYEVDYKKLAESLAAKLENLEQDWNIKKQNYDKFIKQLKNEIDTSRRSISPMENLMIGVKTPAKHVQSLLVVELMTLQLFYNLQRKSCQENKYDVRVTNDVPFTSSNYDMMLQSMEGLLELLSDYLNDRIPFPSKNYSMSSGCSSLITSPDCIDPSASSTYDVPSTLEPVARFLEHAQITLTNLPSNLHKVGDIMAVEQSTRERSRRVLNSLGQLKELVSKKAITTLKETFAASFNESKDKLNSLEEIVNHLDGQKDVLGSSVESLDDIHNLENSLYYLLMDKALLCSMVLLRTQSNKLFDVYNTSSSGKMESCEPEIKRILEDLTVVRSSRDKAQMEVYSLRDAQLVSDDKIKDTELELKTIRELRDSLEIKLLALENKNMVLEEKIEKHEKEKESLEERIEEIEKRKLQLECSLKTSDNNNARKERSIVDLKNEKVALESLVSTLKEEITILEKERSRESDEKRRVEEELEDLRDRNIILETEWSCCREENGLLETELTALEEDKAILEDELSKYRDDVKMLEEAVNVLEAQASDYKQDIMSLKTKEERLLGNVRTEKEKFNKEMNGLKQEMSTLRLERRRFQRDISVSRTDKSNTERAYNALKTQKDSLQDDVTSFKQEEKRLQREISTFKSDKAKLERETNSLKNENSKLKQDIATADKIRMELKLLQKNEDKIASTFKVEKDRLCDNLVLFKDRYDRMEQDFAKAINEKEKLTRQLRKYEQTIHEKSETANVVRRSHSQPTNTKSQTPDKGKMKQCSSMQGALARRSVVSGEVSEVDGKVVDLQRRLAFFMADKEDIQKQLVNARERNTNLSAELKTLETDTSKIQLLLTQLTDEKETLQSKLAKTLESKNVLEKEQEELKNAVTYSQYITKQLRVELEDVSEQNRILEVDYVTVKESAKMLQGETVILSTENEHMKKELQNMENELQQTKGVVQAFNTKIADLKAQVEQASSHEVTLNEKVSFLETENISLGEQVSMCQHEEVLLIQQLAGLNENFVSLESTIEHILVQKENEANRLAVEEIMRQMKKLKEENSTEMVNDLKSQLEMVILEAETLKMEHEEIEKVIQNDDQIMKDRNNGNEKSLAENIRQLWLQLQTVEREKVGAEEKLENVEKQFEELEEANESLSESIQDKTQLLEKEKRTHQSHIEKLQYQIEEFIKDRLHLESEMEFMKSQNDELRRGIAVLLEDNSKLGAELDVVEEEFEKQEKELDSATEETKVLLRQLCAAETKNLNLCTLQSNHQEDLEKWKKQIEKLKKEKEEVSQKHLDSEMKQKTLQERLLMAELEISKLKSEHASVEGQRRLLVDDLDAADRERNILKVELHGLARALSPLKKEVTEVMKKQESLKMEADAKPNHDISGEVARIRDDLSSFNVEKSQLEMEQCELELRLKVVGLEKEDLRYKLRSLIQDLDEQSRSPSKESLSEIAEPIQIVSNLINEKEKLELEEKILSDNIHDAHRNSNILNVCLDNSTNELRCAQEQLCLATVDRLKLKDKARLTDISTMDLRDDIKNNNTDHCVAMDQCGYPRKTGISPLQHEVSKLKVDIEEFEKSQENILNEIRSLNDQLNVAENNLVNVLHFKTIIEQNLRQYKERNNKLETHLRVIYNDLIEMESHMESAPNESTKVLLETLDLQKHFQSLEDDLRNTETRRNSKAEARNRTMKEDASDLMERRDSHQEGNQLNPGLGIWSFINKK